MKFKRLLLTTMYALISLVCTFALAGPNFVPLDVVPVRLANDHLTYLWKFEAVGKFKPNQFYFLGTPREGFKLIPGNGHTVDEYESFNTQFLMDGFEFRQTGNIFPSASTNPRFSSEFKIEIFKQSEFKRNHLEESDRVITFSIKREDVLSTEEEAIFKRYKSLAATPWHELDRKALQEMTPMEALSLAEVERWQTHIKLFPGKFEVYAVFEHPFLPSNRWIALVGPSSSNVISTFTNHTSAGFTEVYESTGNYDGISRAWRKVPVVESIADFKRTTLQVNLTGPDRLPVSTKIIHTTQDEFLLSQFQWGTSFRPIDAWAYSTANPLQLTALKPYTRHAPSSFFQSLYESTGHSFWTPKGYSDFRELIRPLAGFAQDFGPKNCEISLQ